MSLYYLISQLPALDAIGESVPLPITEEGFRELCERFLDKKTIKGLDFLTLTPPIEANPSGFDIIDNWNDSERQLRLALAVARAAKMKKSIGNKDTVLPAAAVQTARNAIEMSDPLDAEEYLNRYRLDMLESMRPLDTFAEDQIFYYGLKLKLIQRIRQFDTLKGQEAYRNIYSSILHGGEQEEIQ